MRFSQILGMIATLPLVSAQNLPAPPIAFDGLRDLFNVILNGSMGGSYEDIVARVLIFLLIAIVLHKPAKTIVKGNSKMGGLISSIVAVMAIRFMTVDMIKGMFLPYQTLGLVLSILIPFVLLAYFMEDFEESFRSIGYFLMAGIFILMWWFRWTDIGDLAYYYLGASVLALLALYFDNSFRAWMNGLRIGNEKKKAIYVQIVKLEKELQDKMQGLADAVRLDDKEGVKALKSDIKGIEKAIEDLVKLK